MLRSPPRVLLLALLVVLGNLAPPTAPGSAPKLRIGEKAPRLSSLDWLQGRPVRSFSRGVIYVIDFWSPEPRARASHQYVGELLRAHPGEVEAVGVIALPSDESDEPDNFAPFLPLEEPGDPPPPLAEQVAQLVAASPEVLSYPLALDEKGRTRELYLEDSGSADLELPISVVVDERGRVAWIGAAHTGLVECVSRLLADDWDLDAARERHEAAWAERLALREEMEFSVESAGRAVSMGQERRELELVTRIATRDPLFAPWRLRLIRMLRKDGRASEVQSEARRYLDGPAGQDPFALIELARELGYAAPEGYDRESDLALAVEVAARAVDLNRRFDPAPLEMLAMLHSFRGELDSAIELQAEALQRAPEWERVELGLRLDELRALRVGGRVVDLDAEQGPAALRIGDRAPALDGLEWVKGSGVRSFRSSRVYVLDFWAPWCAPCIASIPFLDRLARERGPDVEVLGISIWPADRGETTREFVERLGDLISYDIADDAERRVASAYMDAARRDGIPTTMVVDRAGRIAWIGWPDHELEACLDALLAGTWDIDAERERYEAALDAEQRRALLESEHRDLIEAAWDAEADGDVARAADLGLELLALDPLFETWRSFTYRALVLAGRAEDAAPLGEAIFTGSLRHDADALAEFAWRLVESDSGLDRKTLDGDLALRLASRAAELSSRRDAWLLCVLGVVHARRDEYGTAADVFEEALGLTDSVGRRVDVSWAQDTLRSYRELAAEQESGRPRR